MQYRIVLLLEWTLLVSFSSSDPIDSSRHRKSTRNLISSVPSSPSLTQTLSTDFISNSHNKESMQHTTDSVSFPDSSVRNPVHRSALILPDSMDASSLDFVVRSNTLIYSSLVQHKASIISSSPVEWKSTRQTLVQSTDRSNHIDANIQGSKGPILYRGKQYHAGYLIAPSSTSILDADYSDKSIFNEIPHAPLNVKSTSGISEKIDAAFSLSDIRNSVSRYAASEVDSSPVLESTTIHSSLSRKTPSINSQSTGIEENSLITNGKISTSSHIMGASDSISKIVDTHLPAGISNGNTLKTIVTSTELNKDKTERIPETSSILYDTVLIEPSTSPILSTKHQATTAILEDNSSTIRTNHSSQFNYYSPLTKQLLSSTYQTIRPTPSIQQSLLLSSNLYRQPNEGVGSLDKMGTSTSTIGLTIQLTPQSSSKLLPTDTYSSISLTDDSMLEDLVFPDLPSASEILKNHSSDNVNPVPDPMPSLPNRTEHTCSFDNFLHRFLMAEKRLKSSRSGTKIPTRALNPPDTQRTTGISSSTSPTGTQNSGVVCYDDRTSISLPDVDCPKATSRKTSLEDHHLRQLLKNEGDDAVTLSDVEEVVIDKVRKGNGEKTLILQLQQLMEEEVAFYKHLRQQIKEFLTSSTTRDIVSLTHFLTDTAKKVLHELNSNSKTSGTSSYDIYTICELFEFDISSFTSLQSEIENEMLKIQIIFLSASNFEDMYENVQFYNHQSRSLLTLHEKLLSSFLQWNATFRNIVPEILSWVSQSKASPRLTQLDLGVMPNMTSTPESDLDNSKKSKFTAHEKLRSKKTQECRQLKERLELNNKTKQAGINLKSDTNSSDSSPQGSSSVVESYATIISELCHSISSKLTDFKFPKSTLNLTLDVLDDLSNQSTSLMEQFIKQTEAKRTKRSVGAHSPGTCFQQGSRVPQTDFLYMCATCVQTTVLDTSYFPRHLTEKVCKNSGSSSVSQSGSVGVPNGCLNEGGRPGGLCRQQTMTVLLLRQIPGRCMKIVNRGQEFITDQWKLVTYRLRVGCECVVDKNSQFAKYLKFG